MAVPPRRFRSADIELVGRAPELQALDEELDHAFTGHFRVLVIEGGAGIGKTRLLNEVIAARRRRALCMSARSYRLGATSSFGPWLEALDRQLRSRSPAEVRRLCGSSVPDSSGVLEVLGAIDGPARTQPGRSELLEGIAELFSNLSSEGPVLVGMDDMHWADASSWEALRYLARRLSDRPVAVVATTRPGEIRHRPICSEVLVGLHDDDLLTRVPLAPLPKEAIAELANAIVRDVPSLGHTTAPSALVGWLERRSLGYPLFVLSLMRGLIDEGADLADPRLERLPGTLRERVMLDLEALDPSDREVLELLAVVDQRIDPALVARMTGMPVVELDASLRRLCRSMLVIEEGTGADLACEIAHPLVRDAIYTGIGGTRRRELHRVVARTFLASGQRGAAAAHYARSSERGDPEAVDALLEAMARANEGGLYREALVILDALHEILPRGDIRWLRLLEAVPWRAEWVIGHLAEGEAGIAIAAMRRIEELSDGSVDVLDRATVKLHLAAYLSIGEGRLDEADAACRQAVALFEAAGRPERASLARNELAWIAGCNGDLPQMVKIATEVYERAMATGDRTAAIQASGSGAYALGITGRFGEADRRFARSIDLAEEVGNGYRASWGRVQRAFILGLAGRAEEGLALVEGALDTDHEGAADALGLEVAAHNLWLLGRLADAVDRIQESASRRAVRGSRRRAWGVALAARIHGEQVRPRRAWRELSQADEAYEGREILAWSSWCPWTRGFLEFQAGESPKAVDTLGEAAQRLQDSGAVACEALVLVDLAEVLAETGLPGCREAADRLGDIASRVDGLLHLLLAAIGAALATPRRDTLERLEEALGSTVGGVYRMYRGVGLAVLGRARRDLDREAAVAHLQEAATTFDRCGAVWRRDRVVADLEALGSRGRRAAAAVRGEEALTRREREVARLAARGYTAREIA
ncbi:MAG TPA: hypothetical protein ENK55_04415, partial [Actinobacteria bacterium]|nr:hypothetical protein [Actinomycetota bacterium]